jgi:hypothetical protein
MSRKHEGPIKNGTKVAIRGATAATDGVWRVLGQVANSGPRDPVYDIVHLGDGRRRVYRGSRLIVLP